MQPFKNDECHVLVINVILYQLFFFQAINSSTAALVFNNYTSSIEFILALGQIRNTRTLKYCRGSLDKIQIYNILCLKRVQIKTLSQRFH